MANKEVIISTPNGMSHGKGMSVAVKANGFVFISALRGHPAGKATEIPEDTKAQARIALDNLKLVMEHVGGSLEDVVKVTLYLHDLKYRKDFHEVWMEYFPNNPPARIGVQVADANTTPGRNAHFALDVIGLAR